MLRSSLDRSASPRSLAQPGVSGIADETLLLVDGASGELIIEPSIDQQATASARRLPRCLLVNIASAAEVTAALECGDEGRLEHSPRLVAVSLL